MGRMEDAAVATDSVEALPPTAILPMVVRMAA